VVRTFFENGTPLVLRERPPVGGLLDQDQRRTRCCRPAQWLLDGHQGGVPARSCAAGEYPLRLGLGKVLIVPRIPEIPDDG